MRVAFFGNYLFLVPLLQKRFDEVDIYLEEKSRENPEVNNYLNTLLPLRGGLSVTYLPKNKPICDLIPSYKLAFSASFGRIFKNDDIARFEYLFNLHPGPVSLARGRHPLPCAIKYCHPYIGVTLHQIVDENIDCGPVFLEWKTARQDRSYRELEALIKMMAMSSFQAFLSLINESYSNILLVSLDQQGLPYYPPLAADDLACLIGS